MFTPKIGRKVIIIYFGEKDNFIDTFKMDFKFRLILE